MPSFSIRARWVLPIDRPPIHGGFVSVVDGRIAAVGAETPSTGEVTDLGDAVLLPGLVNAHTHLEFSDLSQPLGSAEMSLPAWIRLVIGERKRGNRESPVSIAAGMRESMAAGVTTIGEIATASAAAYGPSGARPMTLQFQEAIGFSKGRVNSVFAELERRLDASPQPAGLSPHAPYTVHPRLLERIVQLARSKNVAVAMHLAESPEELQFLSDGDGAFRDLLEERSMWDGEAISPGSRPLDYLKVLAEAPRAVVIHGNYLAEDEVELIAGKREHMSVVYCPRTHAYFGHSPYPLETMLAKGVRVALGTDSRGSNPDLSLLAEARHIAATCSAVRPVELVRMATLDGAEALGLADVVGSLTVGKRADMVALPCDGALMEPYEGIVRDSSEPSRVWLGGCDVSAAPDSSLRSE